MPHVGARAVKRRQPPPRKVSPAAARVVSRLARHSLSQVAPPKRQRAPTRSVQRAVGRTLSQVVRQQRPTVRAARVATRPKRRVVRATPGNVFREPIGLSSSLKMMQQRAQAKSTAALDASYTQPVALREYGDYLKRTYGKARRFYPGATRKTPGFDFADPHQRELRGSVFGVDPHSGRVIPTARRSVHLTPTDAWAYVLQGKHRGNLAGDFSKFVPLHEWAHVYQRSPDVLNYAYSPHSHALIEGGAQAFANDIAPLLGIPRQSRASNPGYATLSDFVRRTKGRRYVRRGQFGY
jgi:hypothetical protein